VSGTSGWNNKPALATVGDEVIVAWENTDDVSNTEVFVRRYNGSAWVWLAGGTQPGLRQGNSYSSFPVVALDADGNPVVAWFALGWTSATADGIYVRRRVGTTWQAVGGSVTGGDFYEAGTNYWRIALASDALGRPVVAWSSNLSGADEVQLKKWGGSGWVQLSSSASTAGISNSSTASYDVAVAVGNRACATWTEADEAHSQIVLRCHDL
jgi:hypothetical protein